jgi:hypothetical protein
VAVAHCPPFSNEPSPPAPPAPPAVGFSPSLGFKLKPPDDFTAPPPTAAPPEAEDALLKENAEIFEVLDLTDRASSCQRG